ncbi:MAG: S53 family peptidase, partial [Chloroflexota bacterium]|nr:S53 family peptidase [Chloroflexota bacterium]
MNSSIPRAVRRSRGYVSVVMVGLLAVAQIAGASYRVGAANPVTPQTVISRAETKVGTTDAQKEITVSVSLAPNVNQRQMDEFIMELSDPKSPNYKKFLTPKQFTARFLDPAGRAATANFLKSKGLAVKDIGVGSVITATGAAAQVEAAFSVTLNDYTDAAGRTFHANDKTPALPAAVAPYTTAILGLDTQKKAISHVARPTNVSGHAVQANTATGCMGALNVENNRGGYAPNQFATAFDFNTLYNAGFHGEGQTVALFELSDWPDSDVAAYKSCYGLTTPVGRILVNNQGNGNLLDFSGQIEVNLDVDVMLGLLPKAAAINIYYSPNTNADLVDQYQQIATDNTASVISTSWGLCESLSDGTVMGAENTIFAQMATQGQQIFAASGDSGSEDCYPDTRLNTDDPASQPYMVGVGGTTVNINRQSNAYTSETVWNHSGGSTGGGLSQNWARPSWQTSPGTTSAFSNNMREVPDIAAPADPNTGYIVYNAGTWEVVGGTSGAAPLMAAGFALINQMLLARLGHRLGFTNPTLYNLLATAPSVYHDVTVGNNCAQGPDCTTAGSVYPATANYDLATGVGTPKIGAIAIYLAPTPAIPNSRPPGPTSSPATSPLPSPRA